MEKINERIYIEGYKVMWDPRIVDEIKRYLKNQGFKLYRENTRYDLMYVLNVKNGDITETTYKHPNYGTVILLNEIVHVVEDPLDGEHGTALRWVEILFKGNPEIKKVKRGINEILAERGIRIDDEKEG